ncbi:hypothetical protein [uncultured Sulfitobacter sp.]|uniref:hypothetical protein n=1 Tax=uncultured Sulfitobacter sp. TaxID=191468 RepID=UPI0026246F96|nr:hypothetical protein [uncultured Sulfitobacter sp.]
MTVKTVVRAFLFSVFWAGGTSADDFHQTFEARCMKCHGHSGDFARRMLTLKDGNVLGGEEQHLRPFLERHQGGLSTTEIALFLDTFKTQLSSESFFQDRCYTCHGRAYTFVRLNLIQRDGVLIGRYTGFDTQRFLLDHARLTEREAEWMYDRLSAIWLDSR